MSGWRSSNWGSVGPCSGASCWGSAFTRRCYRAWDLH
ncbi:Uncharacterised protein [Mycobacteroides abscessus subsp. abscessus]|nr:Uncharacterised protein [Mycobacteroides abscessus subsp. abscessus]